MVLFSTIIMAWQWLDIGRESQKALFSGDTSFSKEFHENKIHAMQFYFKYELPKTTGLAEVLMDKQALTLKTEKEVFSWLKNK